MSAHTVAVRYANALLMIAVEKGTVEQTRTELRVFADRMMESAEFRIVLESPVIDLPQRHAVIRAVAEKGGMSADVRNFLLLLADRKRLAVVPQIAEHLDRLADDHLGILRARVDTPLAMTESQKATLRTLLEKKYGRKVQLAERLDESILGGFRLVVGNTVMDATLDARLARLRETIVNEL